MGILLAQRKGGDKRVWRGRGQVREPRRQDVHAWGDTGSREKEE